VEKPLITRSILSAVGVAFAVDSYDPVERAAFPIAFQIGGFVQDLGEDRIGLLAYVGVAPTVPILGSGGNTTSIGLLGGLGLAYVANNNGPDEGVKPAAFLSVVVQVGQANPSLSGQSSFGTYEGGTGASSSVSGSAGTYYGDPSDVSPPAATSYGTYGTAGSSLAPRPLAVPTRRLPHHLQALRRQARRSTTAPRTRAAVRLQTTECRGVHRVTLQGEGLSPPGLRSPWVGRTRSIEPAKGKCE